MPMMAPRPNLQQQQAQQEAFIARGIASEFCLALSSSVHLLQQMQYPGREFCPDKLCVAAVSLRQYVKGFHEEVLQKNEAMARELAR